MQSEKTQPEKVHPSKDARTKDSFREEQEEILSHADVVLTGGHGGAVPAFIVWLTKKIFRRSKDS